MGGAARPVAALDRPRLRPRRRASREALALAVEIGDPELVARSLNRLGNWHANAGDAAEAARCHAEALDLAEALGDRGILAETHDLLGMAISIAAGDSRAVLAHYDRAAALREELDDRPGLVIALVMRMLQSGHYLTSTVAAAPRPAAEAERDGARALALAREIGWRDGEAFVRLERALFLGPRGEHARALAEAAAALEIADEIEHRQWATGARVARGAAYLDLLATAPAVRDLEDALASASAMNSLLWWGAAAGLLGSALVAAASSSAPPRSSTTCSAPPRRRSRRSSAGRPRPSSALARGAPADALATLDRLVGPDAAPVPRLALLRGQALAALGDSDRPRPRC